MAEVRAQLSRLVEEAVRTHERIEVTRNGRRAAVILSAEDYDAIIETLEVLGDASLMASIREAEAEFDRGEYVSAEQMDAEMAARGHTDR